MCRVDTVGAESTELAQGITETARTFTGEMLRRSWRNLERRLDHQLSAPLGSSIGEKPHPPPHRLSLRNTSAEKVSRHLIPISNRLRHARAMEEDDLTSLTTSWWRTLFRGRRQTTAATLFEESDGQAPWFADEAESEAAPRYGRADFLRRAREIIDEARVHSSSTVFGLVGPWGSGKSSMLKWLRIEASASTTGSPWNIIDFNPWDYPDPNALQLGFFRTLQASFGESRLKKVRDNISALGVAVAPFTAAVAAFGLYDPSKLVNSASKPAGRESQRGRGTSSTRDHASADEAPGARCHR